MALQQHEDDKILEVETASQLFSRLCGKPVLSTLENKLFKEDCHNKLAEISGPISSGKTEILLHIILNTLLPKTFKDTSVNGIEGK
ncbi:DNA repair protein XRCC2-like isoform X2 [Clytia hemisphaerica]